MTITVKEVILALHCQSLEACPWENKEREFRFKHRNRKRLTNLG